MISGIWWLLFFLLLFFLLFGIAKIKERNEKNFKSKQKSTPIQKLYQKLKENKSNYKFILRSNHITVMDAGNKVAMLTLDRNKPSEKRKLGDIIVINFHSVPNYQTVLDKLSEV